MNINYENKIKELLEKMTLEEKIGQLQQCGPSIVGAFDVSFEELVNMVFDGRLSKEEFQELTSDANQDFHEEDLRAGKIGSYNGIGRSEEHTSELQSRGQLVCRLLLEKKKNNTIENA